MSDPNMSDLEHAFWEGKAEAWEKYKATAQQIQELRALLKEAECPHAEDDYKSVRRNGGWYCYAGKKINWIKSLKRIPDPDNKFTDEEVCQGLDLQAKRISELEQAIKRIVEARLECLRKRSLEADGNLFDAIADAAKMVEDV